MPFCIWPLSLSMFSGLSASLLFMPEYYSTHSRLFPPKPAGRGALPSAIPALPGLTFPGCLFFFSWYEIVGGITLGHDSCALNNVGSGEVSAHHPRPAVPHQSRRELCVQPPRTSSAPRAGQGAAGQEAREVRVCRLLCPQCLLPPPTRCLWGPHWSVGGRRKEAEAPEAESLAHCHQEVPIA